MTIETLAADPLLAGCDIEYAGERGHVNAKDGTSLAAIVGGSVTVCGIVMHERDVEAATVAMGREPVGDRTWMTLTHSGDDATVDIEGGPSIMVKGDRVRVGQHGWVSTINVAAAAALLVLCRAARPTVGVPTEAPDADAEPADSRLYRSAMIMLDGIEGAAEDEAHERYTAAIALLESSAGMTRDTETRASRLLAACPVCMDIGRFTDALRLAAKGLDITRNPNTRNALLNAAEQALGLEREHG